MPPETSSPPLPANGAARPAAAETDVYAVHGADPEVLAYAMAKYSRSSLTLRESLKEISASRAEQFLNTFYFQYGHRSIADLAHVAFAIERLSLLAAIELVDEQRWDGQERSTRYQNFKKSGWYTPSFADAAHRERYTAAIDALFAAYEKVSAGAFSHLKERTARPDDMPQEAFDRTLRARAFDVARYLLPLATNTSLGQIVNARTLETQISRLLSTETAEVRDLGERLRNAASGAAWNVDPNAKEVRVAPTLVKYATPNKYEMETRHDLAQAAAELLRGEDIAASPLVDLIDDSPASELEIDIAAGLLYPVCHFPYRQIREAVAAQPARRRSELVELGLRHRSRHDEMLRPFAAAQGFRFDILMDIGGFRDMHRHRRCVQLRQHYTSAHGFDLPEDAEAIGIRSEYDTAVQAAFAAAGALEPAGNDWRYLLPLGTRCRALFQMDFAEAAYISELRTQPQGHYSYRRVAWAMYEAVAKKHPSLAKFIRATDVHQPVDILKR